MRGCLDSSKVNRALKMIADKLAVLKNTSELMIDLAYSSLFLNSRELAEEVQMLEEGVDEMHRDFELLVLSSGFRSEDSKDFLGLMRMGVVTERIADAAARIAEVAIRELRPHPVLKLVIEEAEETVTRTRVCHNSPLSGKTLREAQIPEEAGMWVLVIRRDGRWLRPRPDTVIQAGDVLVASGYAEGVRDLEDLASSA